MNEQLVFTHREGKRVLNGFGGRSVNEPSTHKKSLARWWMDDRKEEKGEEEEEEEEKISSFPFC